MWAGGLVYVSVGVGGLEEQCVCIVWGDAGLAGGMMQSELGSGSLS